MSITDRTNSYTTTENRSPPNTRNLETIKDEIRSHQETSNESYWEIGRLLLEAKRQFGRHGDWLEWLQNNVDMSICKVQRLMKVSNWLDGNNAPVPHLDFTKACILSRLTGSELKSFLQNLHHEGDSSRNRSGP